MIIGSMEDIVTRLDMRVNTLELRLKTLGDLEERLERHRDCIDRTADALELLGFHVFAPGTDVCDND